MENPKDDGLSITEQEKTVLIMQRTLAFAEIFDYMEANGIDLEGYEASQIARFATHDGLFSYGKPISNLSDVEVGGLKQFEFATVIKRARTAVKQVVELRKQFYKKEIKDDSGKVVETKVFGPFVGPNRKQRRFEQKLQRLKQKGLTKRTGITYNR